jgi:phage terminase large subunit
MPELKVNKAIERAFFSTKPVIVLFGGRGSGKSLGVGDIMTYRMDTEGADVYCLREFQGSIADSVHRVFEGSIKERLQLDDFEIQKNSVIAPNGAKTTYVGANRNPDSMQSAQGYKYSWFEEAHRMSQDSIDKLLPTILRNPGAQCWFTANPQSSSDPFSQRFIVPYLDEIRANGYYEDDVHLIIKVNWRDNPWWNEEQEQLRKWDYENMSRSKYDWIWEGEFNDGVEDALIQPEWFDACVDAAKKLGIKPTGARVTTYDPADTGDDMNAIATRIGIHYDYIDEIDKPNGNLACDEACQIARQRQTDLFVWDGDGMGALLRKQIAQNFDGVKVDTRMYRGSEGVDDPNVPYDGVYSEGQKTNRELFQNKRAQYYVKLAKRMEQTYKAVVHGQYIDPEQLISISSEIPLLMKLRAEVCGIPRKKSFSGKIALMSKEEMKNKYHRKSPNMADCLAMGEELPELMTAAPELVFEGWA